MFDAGKAANWISNNAQGKSVGQCAKYVRMALEAGGLNTNGRPVSAYLYKAYLPSIGFEFIGSVTGTQNQLQWTSSHAQQGDVAVMDHGKHGHICLWTGKEWISDFRQRNMWVYPGDGTCHVFRYTGKISNAPVNFTMGPSGSAGLETPLGDCPAHIKYKRLWNLARRKSTKLAPALTGLIAEANTFIMGGAQVSPDASGVSGEMLNYICHHETGHHYGYKMETKDIVGYDLGDAGGHKTFGYGLLYHPIQQVYMDTLKPHWTQAELESLFIVTVKKYSDMAKKYVPGASQKQIDAITSALFNFGPGFLLKTAVGKMIRSNPHDPAIGPAWANMSNAQGKKYPGLIKRRRFEANWYIS